VISVLERAEVTSQRNARARCLQESTGRQGRLVVRDAAYRLARLFVEEKPVALFGYITLGFSVTHEHQPCGPLRSCGLIDQ
jgi:hypothetical protein